MALIWKQVIQAPKSSFHIQIRNSRFSPFIPVVKKKYEPILYYSLEERLAEKDDTLKNPDLYKKVNIGFSLDKANRNVEKWKDIRQLKDNVALEKQAREGTLKLDLDIVEKDWISSSKPKQIKALAENYAIYKHLFGDYAFFYPVVNMDISYDFDEDTISPVYNGNLLKPNETSAVPKVKFESDPNDLWTLILTSPDGNLFDNESEMVHWFVGNIRGAEVSEGDQIVDYIRPIPPKGTGFHRYCFVLYKQKSKLDFSNYKRKAPCLALRSRTFKTFDFYKEFEDSLTPAGLSWFQADYDSSLSDFFHKTLEMKEPIFEYEFPKPFIRKQRFFPLGKPFNRYLDLHRDPKETQKMMLLKRLARVHPFQGEPALLPFPQAVPIQSDLAIWQKNEIKEERDGKGKYRHMYRGEDRPYIPEGKPKFFPFSKLN